ncbi:MAG: hypothetical protein U0841_12430 [Chloroflexia bacterium]
MTTGRADRATAGDGGVVARGRRAGWSARRLVMRGDWLAAAGLAFLAVVTLWLSFFH